MNAIAEMSFASPVGAKEAAASWCEVFLTHTDELLHAAHLITLSQEDAITAVLQGLELATSQMGIARLPSFVDARSWVIACSIAAARSSTRPRDAVEDKSPLKRLPFDVRIAFLLRMVLRMPPAEAGAQLHRSEAEVEGNVREGFVMLARFSQATVQ